MDRSNVVVTAESIDPDFSPRPIAGVAAVNVGDEVVLLAPDGATHVLNPTGSVLWQLLDGEATVGELVDAFDDVLDGDRNVIADQILEFTRTLGRSGLLEDVARSDESGGVGDAGEPPPLEVGDTLESFTLPDLDGVPVSLDSWRGRRVLLVNWRATCAYCEVAATELARTYVGLSEHGVDLLLVSNGDADGNRRLLEDAGLRVPVLLKRDGVDPFAGFGTPAAYLLDEDGRVAEPMAYGSSEVPRLAAELAGMDDDDAGDTRADPDALDAVDYLDAPRPVCGTGGGAGPSTQEWAGTRAYRIGTFHVGVRYNSRAAAEILDRLFAGRRVRDRRVPDNYSVVLHPEPAGWSHPLNLLVRGGAQVVRSRSTARTLCALLSYLSAETTPLDPMCWDVRGTAVVRDGVAHVLPKGLRGWIKELAPRLERRGFAFVDSPFVQVDPSTCELVAPDLSAAHDSAVLADVDIDGRHDLAGVRPGRYPIAAWHLVSTAEEVGRRSAAWAVATAYPLVREHDDPTRVGEQLAELFDRVPARSFVFSTADDVTRQIEAESGDRPTGA